MKRIQEFMQQFENSNTAYSVFDRNYNVLYANIKAKENARKIFGKELDYNIGMLDFLFPPDKEAFIEHAQRAMENENISIEKSILDEHGNEHWFSYEYAPFLEGNEIVGVIFKAIEVSEKYLRDKQVLLFKEIFNSIDDGICLLDENGKRTWCNRKLCRFSDLQIEDNCTELRAKNLLLDNQPLNLKEVLSKVDQDGVWESTLSDVQNRSIGKRTIHKKIIKMDEYILPKLEYIVISKDISEQEMYKQKSEENLRIDKLTGMNNRSMLEPVIDDRLDEKKNFALLNLDIDSFSGINKLKGYRFGDNLLNEVGERIGYLLPNADMIRSHSDSFFVVCTLDELEDFLTKYFTVDYFDYDGFKYSVSMGISKYPLNASSSKDLVLFSETAMHKAKETSINSFQVYENTLDQNLEKSEKINNSLKGRAYSDFLFLHYQSINRIEDNTVVGYEALIRWKDDELGKLSPLEFIPIAEKNGSILEITQFVLDQVTDDISNNMKAFEECIVSVNISILDLMSETFVDNLKIRAKENPWIKHKIELEVTETSFVDNFEMFQKKIEEIREIGFEVAIDDFGTGFSSLDKLVSVRFDRLKIDRNFISVIFESKADYIVLETIIDLAQKLDMKITAEGVESFDQVLALKHLGISNMQGYYFSKPMSLKDNLTLHNLKE